jgi:dGTPase
VADEITYYSHDLDDGLDSGLLSEKQLVANVRIFADAARFVRRQYGQLAEESRHYFIIRTIIDMQIRDVVENSERLIQKAGVQSADAVRLHTRPLVAHSPARRKLNQELRKYLYRNLYYNPVVHEPNLRAVKLLEQLFKHYLTNPKDLGESSQKSIKKNGLHRAICDYIAGMTDRYVGLEWERLFGGLPK